jgi:pimeloyl-ACP methyl ester carboxylesterase
MVPIAHAGITDARAPFRAMFCAVLREHAAHDPATPSCDRVLVAIEDEPDAVVVPAPRDATPRGRTVLYVLGLGSDCFEQARLVENELGPHLARLGHTLRVLTLGGLSSSGSNARGLADAVLAATSDAPRPVDDRVVVIGHSKGAIDALEMLVTFPDLRPRVLGVVSLAGAIGGSPLANLASDSVLALAAYTPGADCTPGDRGARESLRPATRQAWLARHRLPADVQTYSVVTLPDPDRIAPGLVPGWKLLATIDPRNDGNLMPYDQIVPGSALLGYVAADHWAIGSDLAASSSPLVRAAAGENRFPRRALIEAVLRYIEHDARNTAPR